MTVLTTKIKSWGNGSAIRLNKEILGALGVKIGDEVELSVKKQALIIRAKRRPTLEEMFRDYKGTPESYEIEYETRDWLEMRPAGKELW